MTVVDDPSVTGPFGRWELERRLGSGGFGTAWLARDPSGEPAVVKLLSEPPGDEIRALARIHHPAVVPALGAGTEPRPHLVMGYAPGRPLGDGVVLAPDLAITALALLADGLAACHEAGVFHGDIKPDNVLFDPATGRVTIIDFGLAGGRGGTPRYAAPERAGAGASAPADVYAWALVAWEALAQRLPWPEGASFTARSVEPVPVLPPDIAPDWLSELVSQALDPEPGRRPTAADVVDTCEAQGVALPGRTAEEVARRARTANVDRPALTDAIEAWLATGGALALVGPLGSGRSHAVSRVANELQARGIPFVRLVSAGEPWTAVEWALADPCLPGEPQALPSAADAITRSEAAAELLVGRLDGDASRLVVLVDDIEELDDGSRQTLDVLLREGAAILATADERPEAFVRHAVLAPFAPDQMAQLVRGVLGPVDDTVIEAARAVAAGRPREAVAFLVAAVAADALLWRRRGWVVDPERLEAHAAGWVSGALPPTDALAAPAQRLGALVALAESIDRAEALEVAAADEADLASLVAAGLVRASGQLSCAGRAAAAALNAIEVDRVALARVVVDRWSARRVPPRSRIGPLLVVAADPARIERLGADCVDALAELDIDRALEVASALWACHPTPDLAISHSRALLQAGRTDDARESCLDALGEAPYEPGDVPVLLALARLEAVADDGAARMRWIEAAVAAGGAAAPSAELRLERAHARLGAGDTAGAEDDCLAVCAAPPTPDGVDEWLRAKRLLSQVRERDQGPEAGLAVLDEVPPGLGDQTRERALIEGDRGRLLWHAGRPRAAAAAMEQAATFRRALSLVDRARLENNAGLGWYSAGDLVKAVACWERGLLAFERIGAPRLAGMARANLCQGYRELGRWARAEAIGQAALDWARQSETSDMVVTALGNLGDVALWQRKLSLAEERYDEATRIARSLADGDDSEDLVELSRRRCELAGLRGDDDWAAHLDVAEMLTRRSCDREESARITAMRALAHARDGRQADAERCGRAALDELKAQGAAATLAIARLWVSEAWLELGDAERATEEAQAVVRYAEEFVRPPLQRWAEDVLSRARPDRSANHVERLTQMAIRIAMHDDLQSILDELAAAAVELLEVSRALVVLTAPEDEESGGIRVVARAGDGGGLPSMSIVRRVLESGREVVSGDLEERGDLRGNASVVAMNLRTAICMPLVVEAEVVGALYVDSQGYPGGDLWDAVALFRGLAAHGAVALRNARLTDELEHRALEAESAQYFADALLRAVPTPVVVTAEDGTTVDANNAAVALLGATRRDEVPRRIADCLDRLEGGLVEEYQLHVPRLRRAVPVRVQRASVQTPEGRQRIVYSLADLTPRIAAEVQQMRAISAAREASASKDRFLASMSHELRTPLNAIIGYTELVLEDVDEDEVVTDLQRILAAGRHLLALVDDVLDISRIEAGRLELIVREAPLSEVFGEVVTVVRPEIHATGAKFEVRLADELGVATTDHRRVWQVCTNLLNNALQHSRARTVGLEVVDEGDRVAVEIRDDGVGIPSDRLERLFMPFVEAGTETASDEPRRRGGIGLGLSIARRLAEQLGGELSVASALGSGTTFRFTFLRHLEPGDE